MNGPPHTLRAVPSMIDLDLAVSWAVDEDANVARARALLSGPSGFVRETTVMFETNEGGAVEDD